MENNKVIRLKPKPPVKPEVQEWENEGGEAHVPTPRPERFHLAKNQVVRILTDLLTGFRKRTEGDGH